MTRKPEKQAAAIMARASRMGGATWTFVQVSFFDLARDLKRDPFELRGAIGRNLSAIQWCLARDCAITAFEWTLEVTRREPERRRGRVSTPRHR
jgi:hypothetical protein